MFRTRLTNRKGARAWRKLRAIACAGLVIGNACGQQPGAGTWSGKPVWAAGPEVSYSLSQQFVIRGARHTGWLPELGIGTNLDLVRLEPSLLAVSCERVKKATLAALRVPRDTWRGRIRVELHAAQNPRETIALLSTKNPNGWDYAVYLPDAVEQPRLVAAIVQILLQEMADRGSTGGAAEIPGWLVEGLSRQLMLDSEVNLVVQRFDESKPDINSKNIDRSGHKIDPLTAARQVLASRPPLTIEELSWQEPDQLDAASAEAYRCNAQLFVRELLRLPDGPACLLAFVRALPQHFNWQFSFLEAFHSDFATQRDVEKWWALRLTEFTGRNLLQTWSREESWRKLDEIIRPPVEVRASTNDLPLLRQVALQTIILDWDFIRQGPVLRDKLAQLNILRLFVSQELAPLTDGYRRALQTYLDRRTGVSVPRLTKSMITPSLKVLEGDCIQELNELDAEREKLRPAQPTEPSSRPDTSKSVVNN
jgi:hypothetical protein